MTKHEMLEQMEANGWSHELKEKDSYKDIKEEYELMIDEFSDDSYMFPNGRDYDAEDEDGF